jgi:hypothetical protein
MCISQGSLSIQRNNQSNLSNICDRCQWRGNFTTRNASGVLTVAASSHTHPMLLWMELFTASTTLLSCSRRREATIISSRLLQLRKMGQQSQHLNQKLNRRQPSSKSYSKNVHPISVNQFSRLFLSFSPGHWAI